MFGLFLWHAHAPLSKLYYKPPDRCAHYFGVCRPGGALVRDGVAINEGSQPLAKRLELILLANSCSAALPRCLCGKPMVFRRVRLLPFLRGCASQHQA